MRWISATVPKGGIAQVYVDGKLVSTVNTYAQSTTCQTNSFTKTGLTRGSHQLKIAVTGTKSSASSNSWVVVDAFDVQS